MRPASPVDVDLLPAPPGDWVTQAACVEHDPDLWYPPAATHPDTRRAVAICQDCPVRADCLDYAVTERISDGIWGGLNGWERAWRRRQRPPGEHTREETGHGQ